MAQHLIKAIILGTQVVGRAFAKAVRNEFAHSRAAQNSSARESTAESAQATRITGMSLDEAKQILNVSELDPAKIKEKYDVMFKLNDKTKGGSFYLQSKVYRANERILEELKAKGIKIDTEEPSKGGQSNTPT